MVSLITTYQGFLFLANNLAAAAALALAIQTTLFWTARELGRKGASWKEGTIFCISAALSISFSYAFIADALTTRDASSTNLVKQIGNALE
ncbi:MAG TPA: hypothetical protein VLX28_20715, partial [Thermoanaerobaculia bacterium]|nr:hypothetical protein [Thermoanaerobaculia bacterium]